MKKIVIISVLAIFMMVGCTQQPVAQNPQINQPTKSLYKNEKAMYQKFQGKKANDELERELNK